MNNESSEVSPIFSLTPQDLGARLPRWQITATTIYCDVVKRYVSLKISKDWHIACIYHQRRRTVRQEKKKGILRLLVWMGIGYSERYVKEDDCKGAEKCPKLLKCLEKLYRDEMTLKKEGA